MNNTDRETLLNDVLAGENLESFRQSSLAAGVIYLRRRRRRVLAVRTGFLAIAVCAAACWLAWPDHSAQVSQLAKTATESPASPEAPSESSGKLHFINDDELLALFPNRSVALIGKPGNQRLIFLDQASN